MRALLRWVTRSPHQGRRFVLLLMLALIVLMAMCGEL